MIIELKDTRVLGSEYYKTDTIEVHIICHSHTDAGWYYTYDYYFNSLIKGIFSTVIRVLDTNEDYR